MASQDPQTLLTAANCYSCFGSDRGLMELLKLGLLKQILIAQNPMAATDPQSLLSQANCYSCFANSPGIATLLELALLAQIAANGSTGGGGSGAVSSLIAGTNITLSPGTGVGNVTINSTAAGNPAPGVVNPNGVVTGAPGAVYVNTANQTLWIQESAITANTGWIQFI